MRLYKFPFSQKSKDYSKHILEVDDDYCLEDVLKMEELTLPKVN